MRKPLDNPGFVIRKTFEHARRSIRKPTLEMKLYDHVHVQLRVRIMHGSHMDWKDGKTFSSQGIFEQTGTLPKLLEK